MKIDDQNRYVNENGVAPWSAKILGDRNEVMAILSARRIA